MNYIVLDTNIFIHFKDFDQIDWKAVSKSGGDFCILMPPTVIDELDSHKYHKNPKISKRVRRILPKIVSFLDSNKLIRLISTRPRNETFISNQLNKDEQDDRILAAILEFQQSLNDNDTLVYITNDTGPYLKARTLAINSIKIADSYLLPEESDENEKKIKELEKELIKFRNQSPKIVLGFGENDHFYRCNKKEELKTKEEFISESIIEIKKEYPYLEKIDFENNENTIFKALSVSLLSDYQIEEYNSKLKSFYKKYKNYYNSIYQILSYLKDCIEIKLVIRNEGTAPAEDIDLELHFPDGFALHTIEKLPKSSQKPKPPYKPKHRYDFQQFDFHLPQIISNNLANSADKVDLNYTPTIRKTNSYNVDFHLRSLKHNQSFEFKTLYLKYEDRNLAKNFYFEYKIMIGNYPESINGKLNVIVE